jgi:hypothetical protein
MQLEMVSKSWLTGLSNQVNIVLLNQYSNYVIQLKHQMMFGPFFIWLMDV